MNGKDVNVMFGSGAGCSVIDIGSLEYIVRTQTNLRNASGDSMDVLGCVEINVKIRNIKQIINHEFKVTNSKTYRNILLGRDFMKLFKTVKFDLGGNKIQLGDTWLTGIDIKSDENVRLVETSNIPARSEKVILVRCKKNCSMITSDFEPKTTIKSPGIFISKARVIPNLHGIFSLSVLNITETDK